MKILIVTSTALPNIGGVEVCIYNIMRCLLAKGYQVKIFTFRKHWIYTQQLGGELISYALGTLFLINLHSYLGRWYLERQLVSIQRKENFDLWHVFFAYPFGFGVSRIIKKLKIPAVLSCRGEDIQKCSEIGYGVRLNPKIDKLIKESVKSYSLLTSLTQSVTDEYRNLGISDDKIIEIPNGVDLKLFERKTDYVQIRKKFGIPLGKKLILSVGRNHPKKGFKYLVQALVLLRKVHGDDFICLIVGKGTSELQKLAQRIGVGDFVMTKEAIKPDLVGRREMFFPSMDLIALYKSSDLFVLPSLIETFGIVNLEAMAAGLPIITTDAPGCRDVVTDGYNGLIVKPGKPDELAEKIAIVLKNRELACRLARNAFYTSKQYDWDIITKKYLDTYKKILRE